jgi:hypothetical protein
MSSVTVNWALCTGAPEEVKTSKLTGSDTRWYPVQL